MILRINLSTVRVAKLRVNRAAGQGVSARPEWSRAAGIGTAPRV